jgi:hypothetical protein
MVTAGGLRVSPPGDGAFPIDGFSFPTCKKTGIMSVRAVRSHTEIPAFTAR